MAGRTAAELDAFTGLRRGELIGLQWTDVDFENLVIHVRRSVVMMVHRTLRPITDRRETLNTCKDEDDTSNADWNGGLESVVVLPALTSRFPPRQ